VHLPRQHELPRGPSLLGLGWRDSFGSLRRGHLWEGSDYLRLRKLLPKLFDHRQPQPRREFELQHLPGWNVRVASER
jgi:hypothetical protein